VPNGMREDCGGALTDVNGDSPLTQPTLKIVEVRLHVADGWRWLAGCGNDGRVFRVEDQLYDMRG